MLFIIKFLNKIRTENNNDFEQEKHNNFKGSKDKLLRLLFFGIYNYNSNTIKSGNLNEKIPNK